MEKLTVQLNKKEYPVIITHKLLHHNTSIWPLHNGDRVVFITDDQIAPIYLNKINNTLSKLGIITNTIILQHGEKSKSLITLDTIYTTLISQNYDRDTILIALGGGVIGDITGFIAATYQRGIRYIQLPTTLLAQVDASIGGKTGINHTLGKNMIGAFYQPIAVIINLDYLNTLTNREFSSGLSEVIKYAISFDANFFYWLEKNLDNLLKLDIQSLSYCIHRCCEFKIHIITIDEHDDQGVRNLLNLGHTYGHAIESYLQYTKWSHGEAVAAGIMMAINTALHLGEFNKNDAQRIKSLLTRANLPVKGPTQMTPEDYLIYMARDKKSKSGQLNLILPTSIGCVKTFSNLKHQLILQSIKNNI